MTENNTAANTPLWLQIEQQILNLSDLSEGNVASTIKQVAGVLDNAGCQVSDNGGNWLLLKGAMDARLKAGKPMLKDFNEAVGALKLEDVGDTYKAAMNIMGGLGKEWPALLASERRGHVQAIVEETKLNLLIAKAKELSQEFGSDQGIRFLITQQVAPESIISALGITQDKLTEVNAAIKAEKAEKLRVSELLSAVAGKSNDERIKHLLNSNVAEALIIELGAVDQAAIEGVKKAMEAELAEKKRLEEEAAAKKAADAAGPSLDNIPDDEMLEHIEGIREILDFSDQEAEIRTMCAQSNIPICLVDIAVSDPDKLDELEKKAGG